MLELVEFSVSKGSHMVSSGDIILENEIEVILPHIILYEGWSDSTNQIENKCR